MNGLNAEEAVRRLAMVGPNALPESKPDSFPVVFLRQFRNPLVYILLASAGISAVTRDFSDAGFILVVLTANALIGSVQEYGAAKSAAALRALSAVSALVLRNGHNVELDAKDVVPGDVISIEAGSKIPADVYLLSASGVEVDESLLTGESAGVAKNSDLVLAAQTPLADRTNLAFAATLLTRGRISGVVIATGIDTQIGHIASTLSTAQTTEPPLLVRMDHFSKRIALWIGIAVVLLGTVSVLRGSSVGNVFLLAVALAVSAIPEGLPVALTVALSIGAKRMGRRKVIAQRLVAVESLGSCTFIASDKTGTLTMNELAAQKVLFFGQTPYEIGARGEDCEVKGDLNIPKLHLRLCVAASLCNNGVLDVGVKDGTWVTHGDAVDVALLSMSQKAGFAQQELLSAHPRLAEIPFEPENRYAATLHLFNGIETLFLKGAGEAVLPMCDKVATTEGDVQLGPEELLWLEQGAERLAKEGYRLLAIAETKLQPQSDESTNRMAEKRLPFPALDRSQLRELTLLGFVAMIDPLRPETRDSVKACQAAGIRVAMVTGDHPTTALAIAKELGLADSAEQVVTGQKLSEWSAQGVEAVDRLVSTTRVFARVEPNQKVQIVDSLKRLGHFVAVTGDGANDAPALRAAHIGVAMGKRGTDVAKECADLILADDNFSSIVAGVEEGRIAYANVRKVVYLSLSSGLAEVLLFVFTTAFGMPSPLWPVQLLWLNLVTNGVQDVALAFEPGEGNELKRPPRPTNEPIFDRLMLERMFVSAILVAVMAFCCYRFLLSQGLSLGYAQNLVLLLLVLFENIQAGNSRSETGSVFGLHPLKNRALFFGAVGSQALHLAATFTPGLQKILHIQPVSFREWAILCSLSLSLLFFAEVHKVFLRKRAGS